MKTSDIIKEIIQEKGISQAKFAKMIGYHPVTLCNFLKNDDFSPKCLSKIAEVFDCNISDLLPYQEVSVRQNVFGYVEVDDEIIKIKKVEDLFRLSDRLRKQKELMKTKHPTLKQKVGINLSDIILDNWECYDATMQEIKSFRHWYDIVDGRQYSLGNMCCGYPYYLNGVRFMNSEAAYIAGLYSLDNPEHIRIQTSLSIIDDGYRAKKEYRNKRYDYIKRDDWNTFNVEWMKYVVWQKCKNNLDFAALLKSVPRHTMIVENSTGMTGATAQFWGCFNQELEDLRDAKQVLFKNKHPKATDEEINIERNKWHNFGVWEGTNTMGKILKMCSLCLLDEIELPLDVTLLNNAHIHLLGKKLSF